MKFKLLFTFLLTCVFGFAQVIPDEVKPPSWNLEGLPNVKAHKLASFNLKKLQEEDKINDKDKSKPWRFGHDIYVDHDFNEVGKWTTLDNGDRIWRMSYTSEGALTLNFMFDIFKIPEGAKLYVYNDEKTDLLRPFTYHNNNPEEVLGTWFVEGNKAWIEYYEPANAVGMAKLTIGSVVHGYRTAETYQKNLGDSGDCNHDVDCDITPFSDPYGLNTVKENVKKSVAMLVSGGGFCSGTLVNNTNNDGTPYFMTANHCGGGEGFWAFRFNWRSPNPSCGTTVNSPNGSYDQTVSGATLRANSAHSDMELVEINDASFFNNNPDVVWAGWNRSTTATPNVNFGIHHPSGDIQKVCRDDGGAFRTSINFGPDPNTQMWQISDWDLGVTEQGSSGSALFNETGHLIGMLSGGTAACSGTNDNGGVDVYGRFGVAWNYGSSRSTRLKEWLDPSNSNVEVLDLYSPFNTYNIDARSNAGSNDIVNCNGDFYPEVTLINSGVLNLTSANVTYYIDSEVASVINWTGNLTSGSSVVVATPNYTNLSTGNHVFTIIVSSPNGTSDDNTSNDVYGFNFDVSPSYLTSSIIFNLTTDNYGSETSWEVTDSSGAIVNSGPIFSYSNSTTYQETISIPAFNDCYTFTIYDSASDGVCCDYGIGSYSLEDANGTVIISGGDFGSSESITFNVLDPLSVDEYDLENYISFYPNPVKDDLSITVRELNENIDYEVFNMLGQTIYKGSLLPNNTNNINMTNYQSGVYFVKLSTLNSSFTKKIMKN